MFTKASADVWIEVQDTASAERVCNCSPEPRDGVEKVAKV